MKQPPFHPEAGLLKALGSSKRLEIVHLLGHRQLTATEIEDMTGLPQANLSQHLRALKEARAIVAARRGKFMTYRLAHPSVLAITRVAHEVSRPRRPTTRVHQKTAVQDPVCGMWVEPVASRWQAIYKGGTFFFCAAGCQKHFIHFPERYAKSR